MNNQNYIYKSYTKNQQDPQSWIRKIICIEKTNPFTRREAPVHSKWERGRSIMTVPWRALWLIMAIDYCWRIWWWWWWRTVKKLVKVRSGDWIEEGIGEIQQREVVCVHIHSFFFLISACGILTISNYRERKIDF